MPSVSVPRTTVNCTASLPLAAAACVWVIPLTAWTVTAHLPSPQSKVTLAVPVASATIQARSPVLTGAATVSPAATSLTVTAHIPSARGDDTFEVPSTSAVYTAHSPTLTAGVTAAIPATSMSATVPVPTVTAGGQIAPPLATAQYTASTPTLTAGAVATVPATSWTATAHVPTATGEVVDLSGDFNRDCITWLDYTITVSGGTASIVLYAAGVEVASGSGAVGGAVAFTGDHISGSVTVAADAATDSGRVYFHYPKYMRIKRDTSNPPTTVVATVAFDKKDQRTWTEPSDLTGGTYYYRIQPINAEGDVGDDSTSATKTIYTIPEAPTALAYASGGAAACVITWTKSTTAGCTYNVYVEQPGTGYMDLSTPTATTLADAETATIAISPTTGTARVVVRAEKSGVEEKNLNVLTLQFSSGTYVTPTPNTPTMYESQTSVDVGNVLRTVVNYPTTDEWGVATKINLYKRAQGGSYNYASPLATGLLQSAREGIKQATVVGSLGADGVYYVAARAQTAAGAESTTSSEIMVVANTANLAAPPFTAIVARG